MTIKIGALVEAGELSADLVRTLEETGFESLSISFWERVDEAVLDSACALLKSSSLSISALSVWGNPLESDVVRSGWSTLIAAAHPDPFHVACSELALQSGFAVFCEKPLGTGLQEAKRLEPYAADAIFMVNFSKRSTPAIEAARSVLEAGELGSIEHIEIAYRQGWQQTHAWGDPDEVFRWK